MQGCKMIKDIHFLKILIITYPSTTIITKCICIVTVSLCQWFKQVRWITLADQISMWCRRVILRLQLFYSNGRRNHAQTTWSRQVSCLVSPIHTACIYKFLIFNCSCQKYYAYFLMFIILEACKECKFNEFLCWIFRRTGNLNNLLDIFIWIFLKHAFPWVNH